MAPFSLDVHTSITSVGGTNGENPETGVSFSGGGFSNYFSRPLYQEAAVTQYFEYLGDQNAGLYNPNGRGFPDVAAYAVAFDIVWDGYDVGVAGTSCASPTFASVVTLLNDELLAAINNADARYVRSVYLFRGPPDG